MNKVLGNQFPLEIAPGEATPGLSASGHDVGLELEVCHGRIVARTRISDPDSEERFLKSVFYGAILILFTLEAHTADRIFECRDAKGKTTYTNVPCEGQVLKPEELEESAYKSPYGEWLGQVQFKETTGKGTAAHAVAPLTIMIEAGGKLTGASNETGCKALGIAAPGAVSNLLSLDVTLRECHDDGFNRHYNGTLGLYPAQRHAQLILLSVPRLSEGKAVVHDLTGTLRR
jgi:hypothetical protein